MEKIDFVFGDEKRFSEFVSRLGKEKVALVSHTDLDGIASAKLANEILNVDLLKFIGYHELDDSLIEELRKERVRKVVFTDLFLKDADFVKRIGKFAEVLIIDHHLAEEDFNSDRIVFLNARGYCASYLCYYLFGKIRDLHKFDWLVVCASIADYAYEKNMDWMNRIFESYDEKFFIDFYGLKKSRFWRLQWDLSLAIVYWETKNDLRRVFDDIGSYKDVNIWIENAKEVQKEIDSVLEKFDKEKRDVNGRVFFEFKPGFKIGSIVSNVITQSYFDKTIIIARIHDDYYAFSVRRQDGKENMSELAGKLVFGFEGAEGGGHLKAAGGHILLKDIEEFKRRLEKL